MGNCLVTKLKGVVDNDNLKILGQITLAVSGGSVCRSYGIPDGSVTRVTVNCTFEDGSTVKTVNGDYRLANIGDSPRIILYPMYNLARLDMANNNAVDFDESALKYMPLLVQLDANNSKMAWSIEKILETCLSLTSFSCGNSKLYGSFKTALNKIAPLRPGTQINDCACSGSVTDIPRGIGENYATRGVIYFDSNTTKYPNGWYVKNIDGTYYDSNGNVITP